VIVAVGLVAAAGCVVPPDDPNGPWVLVFTRTQGFRHSSIEPAARALAVELHDRGVGLVITDNPGIFTPARLAGFEAVVFLSTTGDVLDGPQQTALQQWVQGGGGWAGIHGALDAEYGWPFYETLAGARFASHPVVQTATVHREDPDHPSTAGLPAAWSRADEWYNTQPNPRPGAHVLATVDEATYTGGTMGSDHPIAWCHAVGAGQSFVTAMGHTDESWSDPAFVDHVAGGIVSVTQPGTCT
jgi:type 1 glutamine amidotransferase